LFPLAIIVGSPLGFGIVLHFDVIAKTSRQLTALNSIEAYMSPPKSLKPLKSEVNPKAIQLGIDGSGRTN